MPKIKDTTHKNKKKSKYSKHKQEVNKEYAMLDEQGNELFDVEFIFGKKIDPISQEIKYLVKWKGFKQSDSTWEPLANLITVYSTVRDYDLKQSRALFNLKYLKSPIERENEIFLKTGVDQIGNTQSFANIIQEDLEKQFKSNENEDNLKTSKNNKNKKEQNKLNNEKVINKEIIDMNKESKETNEEEKANKNKKENLKRVVGEFGKDYPKRIIKHKIGKFSNDNNISRVFYKIEWTCDSQNNKPKSGYHSIEDLKENCPILLIEYFEKNAILIDNNNKKFI